MPKAKTVKSPKAAKPIGAVTHYYGGIGVAIVKFTKAVGAGTKVRFQGATTNFEQEMGSMQYDHKDVKSAPKGKEIGVKVDDKVREGDQIFLVE